MWVILSQKQEKSKITFRNASLIKDKRRERGEKNLFTEIKDIKDSYILKKSQQRIKMIRSRAMDRSPSITVILRNDKDEGLLEEIKMTIRKKNRHLKEEDRYKMEIIRY